MVTGSRESKSVRIEDSTSHRASLGRESSMQTVKQNLSKHSAYEDPSVEETSFVERDPRISYV